MKRKSYIENDKLVFGSNLLFGDEQFVAADTGLPHRKAGVRYCVLSRNVKKHEYHYVSINN